MNTSPAKWIPSVLSYAVLGAVVAWSVLTFRHDLDQLSLAYLTRYWDLIALTALLSIANYGVRISRWRFYLRRLGHTVSRTFCAWTYIAGFAYTVSPGKVGEMVRARYYLPLGISLKDITAAFVAERLLDLLAMIVLACGLILATGRYTVIVSGTTAAIIAMLGVLALAPWGRIQAACAGMHRLPSPARKALCALAATLESTRPLLRPGILALGFGAALLAWGMEGMGLSVLSNMFPDTALSPVNSVGIYAVAVVIGALSFLPGGLGTTEAIMTALLVSAGCPAPAALVLTLLCRLVTLWLAVALGWVALLTLKYRPIAAVTP